MLAELSSRMAIGVSLKDHVKSKNLCIYSFQARICKRPTLFARKIFEIDRDREFCEAPGERPLFPQNLDRLLHFPFVSLLHAQH
jgi:hypothetical protein